MDINTDSPFARIKAKMALADEAAAVNQIAPGTNTNVYAAVMVCLALEEVASELGRIADILTVRLK